MDTAPLDDIRGLLDRCPPANDDADSALRERLSASNTVRAGGEAAELAGWLAQWSGSAAPAIRKPLVAIFAGSHGIAAHGVSQRTAAEVVEAVERCQNGTGAINKLCTQFDLGLKVFDLALDMPTADFTAAPALDERGCAATMAFGMEALAEGPDLVCLGAFGAGAATAAVAILCALHGGEVEDWAEPVNAAVDARRRSVVQAGLRAHDGRLGDPLQVLSRFGGREFAAIAGAIVAARFQSVPVVLDGPAALASALLLDRARPGVAVHCRLAAPAGTKRLHELAAAAGLEPILARSFGSMTQEPLDGAAAMSLLRGVAAIV